MCRCNIPVVIMGETGCGKTRLIRYMCELARQGLDVRNMFILKVCNLKFSSVKSSVFDNRRYWLYLEVLPICPVFVFLLVLAKLKSLW